MKILFSFMFLMVGLTAVSQDSYTTVKQRIVKWNLKQQAWQASTEWIKSKVEVEFDGHKLIIYDRQTLVYNLNKVVDNQAGLLSWDAVDSKRKPCFIRIKFNPDSKHDLFIVYETENWAYQYVISSE